MTPKVTIITITYNAGRFLKNTIDSILGQTNTEFEYLIVDGGSKDDTLDIIRQYPNRQYASFEEACGREGAADGLIHWISEPDKGLYDAMNKGIRLAKGSFVWFVNAGDKIYDSNTLKAVVDTIDQNPECDVVYEEFKGTGNMELQLDRNLSNKRIFPAVNLVLSSTRRDDLLYDPYTNNRIWILRKLLADMNPVEAMTWMQQHMDEFKTNKDLIDNMSKFGRYD